MKEASASRQRTLSRLVQSPVLRRTAGTVATNFAAQALVLVSGVLAARLLGPTDRGYLALLTLIPIAVSQLGGLGLPLATTYYVARTPAVAVALRRRIVPVLGVQALGLLLLHAGILALTVGGQSSETVTAGIVSLALTPLAVVQLNALAFLQGAQRFKPFNVLRILRLPLYSGGLVAVALADSGELVTITAVWAGANAIATAATVAYAVRPAKTEYHPAAAPDDSAPSIALMVRFGLRSLLGYATPIETFRLDQAIIGFALTPKALGLYVAALSFTNLPRFIAQAVGLVALPAIAAEPDVASRRRTVWRFVWPATGAAIAVVGILEVLAGWMVPFFFGRDFVDAVPLVRILLLGAIFMSARRILSDGLSGAGHPGLGSLAEAVSWIWLLPLLAGMTALWGTEGVAWALTAAYAGSFVYLLSLAGLHGFYRLPLAVEGRARSLFGRLHMLGAPGVGEPPGVSSREGEMPPASPSEKGVG